MFNGARYKIFLDFVIAAGHHIDVLAIPRFFLVKSLFDEELKSMMKVLRE
jgi:hypothetical protein